MISIFMRNIFLEKTPGNRRLLSIFVSTLYLWAAMAGWVYSQSISGAGQRKAESRENQSKEIFEGEPDEEYFRGLYRNFYETYRLGPGDEIAIRVLGQPDYSLPKIKVSPVGRIYHPLVGDIEVVGFTIPKLEKKLTTDFSEYVINPQVSVSLEEAQSAKIGVLGEVRMPSIVIISRPLTILEAINSTGGFTETADRSDVILLRQDRNGMMQHRRVDVKKILDGKAGAEENLMVRSGDTIIVNGNFKKKMGNVVNSLRFLSFLSFIAYGR